MAEPLKVFFSPALVRRLAADIASVHAAFPSRTFVDQACAGLDALELIDRGKHIARALATHLPTPYPAAIDVLLRSLGPEHASDELIGAGMAPFFYAVKRGSADALQLLGFGGKASVSIEDVRMAPRRRTPQT